MKNADPPSLRYGAASGHRFWARAKPPKATLKPPASHLQATCKPSGSQRIATPKLHPSSTQATLRPGIRSLNRDLKESEPELGFGPRNPCKSLQICGFRSVRLGPIVLPCAS